MRQHKGVITTYTCMTGEGIVDEDPQKGIIANTVPNIGQGNLKQSKEHGVGPLVKQGILQRVHISPNQFKFGVLVA